MELKEKIKVLADTPGQGIIKLHPLGGSYALIMPKFWVYMNCTEVDSEYYVKMEQVDGNLLFRSIDIDEIRDTEVRKK